MKPSIHGDGAKVRSSTKNKKHPKVLDLLDYLAEAQAAIEDNQAMSFRIIYTYKTIT